MFFSRSNCPMSWRMKLKFGVLAMAPMVAAAETLPLDTLVVNGESYSGMRAGIVSTTLDFDRIQQSAPGNAADILRNVPGIYAHGSGGEGNANVSVRGLPLGGGAKFVQFMEDGLPVLGFGDIDFATSDTFLRSDYNLDRLEVIRGGSASTLASNAPGGVFNFISRTGETRGGNVGVTRGLDFDRTRADFDYGGPIDGQWRFHVGGFYRGGEGPKTAGYDAEDGGQIKGNITREFDKGFVRLNFKILEDRAPVYLPVPVAITGTPGNLHVASLPGFDIRDGAMQSKHFRTDLAVNRAGQTVTTDIADGYYSSSQAFGGEMQFEPAQGWQFNDKFRIAATSGRFVGPYPAEVDTAAALARAIGGNGASLQYANGPLAGQAADANALAVRTHLFNVELNDLGNFANDLSLSKTFDSRDFGSTRVTAGYFKSGQAIVQDWHWNTYLQEVKGKNSALLDVAGANGSLSSQNGLLAYGEPYWGNCCTRSYDLYYHTDAPYLALAWQKGDFSFDGSLRYDIARASGSYAGARTQTLDVNGDGVIETPEQAVPVVDRNTALPVDYTVGYLSYSFGAGYLLKPDLSLFARISEGGRANAERLLFGGGIRNDGGIADKVAVNKVRQYETGIKWRGKDFGLLATLFHAETSEVNQDVTAVQGAHRFANRDFEAQGVELETAYYFGDFSLNGGVTYTHSRVVRDEINPANVGDPTAPEVIYQFTPAYQARHANAGVNFIGNSDIPAGKLMAPGFIQVNAFAGYELVQGLWLSVNGNNLFDTVGLTEISGNTGISANGLNAARSILGRTVTATVKYAF
jgi:outer membrane receptor protein involved in Fe transport